MRISDWSSDVCSSDLLRGRKPPQLHEDLYARAEAVLKRDGIAHADLLARLVDGKADGETFLRTDTHWTPRGAQLAAAAIRSEEHTSEPQSLMRSSDVVFRLRKINNKQINTIIHSYQSKIS